MSADAAILLISIIGIVYFIVVIYFAAYGSGKRGQR